MSTWSADAVLGHIWVQKLKADKYRFKRTNFLNEILVVWRSSWDLLALVCLNNSLLRHTCFSYQCPASQQMAKIWHPELYWAINSILFNEVWTEISCWSWFSLLEIVGFSVYCVVLESSGFFSEPTIQLLYPLPAWSALNYLLLPKLFYKKCYLKTNSNIALPRKAMETCLFFCSSAGNKCSVLIPCETGIDSGQAMHIHSLRLLDSFNYSHFPLQPTPFTSNYENGNSFVFWELHLHFSEPWRIKIC